MRLTPAHKLSLVALAGGLLASLLVWAGFVWGASSARAEERMLTLRQARAAQQRMAAAGDEPAALGAHTPPRLSKARYIAWLEARLDDLDEQVQHETASQPAREVPRPAYAEFARLVLTAAQSVASTESQHRMAASKAAVSVLTAFWQESHDEALELPADLFARPARVAVSLPAPASAKESPPREAALGAMTAKNNAP